MGSNFEQGPRRGDAVGPKKINDVAGAVIASIILLFFLLFGFFFNLGLAKTVIKHRSLVATGMKANGTVIGLEWSSGRGKSLWPIVSFVTADGKAIRFQSLRPNHRRYFEGDTVPVLYDPRDPTIAEINMPEVLWGGLAGGFAGGTLFMVVGGGILFALIRAFSRRKRLEGSGII